MHFPMPGKKKATAGFTGTIFKRFEKSVCLAQHLCKLLAQVPARGMEPQPHLAMPGCMHFSRGAKVSEHQKDTIA